MYSGHGMYVFPYSHTCAHMWPILQGTCQEEVTAENVRLTHDSRGRVESPLPSPPVMSLRLQRLWQRMETQRQAPTVQQPRPFPSDPSLQPALVAHPNPSVIIHPYRPRSHRYHSQVHAPEFDLSIGLNCMHKRTKLLLCSPLWC